MFLTPNSGDGKIRFATSTVHGYNEQVLDGDAALPTNEWVHVAVTLSGRVETLYVDGVAVGTNLAMDFPPFHDRAHNTELDRPIAVRCGPLPERKGGRRPNSDDEAADGR